MFRKAVVVLVCGSALLAVLSLTAHAESAVLDERKISQLWSEQKFKAVIDLLDAAKARPDVIDPGLLHYACDSYLKVRRFGVADECYARMQRDRDKIMANALLAMNDRYWDYVIHTGRSELALEIGNPVRAIEDGTQAYRILANREIRPVGLFGGLYTALGGAARFDLSNAMAIPVQGVLATAYAKAGSATESRRHLAELEQMLIGGLGNMIPAEEQAPIRYWMSQTYLALGEFEAAYRATLIEKNSLVEAIWGLNNDIGTPVTAVLGEIFSHDYDEARRLGRIENEYVRARALLGAGKLVQARGYLDALLADARIEGFGGIYYLLLYDRGRVALAEGDRTTAVTLWKRAIEVLEAQRASIHDEAGKIAYAGGRQRIYVDLVRQLVDLGRADEAFIYAERGKARALVDMMAGRSLPTRRASDTILTRLERLRAIEPDTSAMSAGPAGTRSARNLLLEARRELQRTDPEVASLVAVSVPDLTELQSMLDADEVLVEFFGDDRHLVAFVLTRNSVQARILDGQGLVDTIGAWRKALSNPAANDHLAGARSLYDRLLRPLEALIDKPRLSIVPHGALHYAPFAAMHDGTAYFIERKTLRLLPAASLLKFLKPRPLAGPMLAFGNPDLRDARLDLPGAQKEVERISATRPQVSIFLRAEASEGRLKSLGPKYPLLHIASHGVFTPERPLDSALMLAADATDDGRLTAAELYDLRLDAAIVVLSACETGLGKVAQGDDVVGLNRGFLFAGARSIVSSLWPVADDSTAELMEAFYERLGDSDASHALQAAQLRQLAKRPHPFHWAPFQLSGMK